jgi:hypothetical protein
LDRHTGCDDSLRLTVQLREASARAPPSASAACACTPTAAPPPCLSDRAYAGAVIVNETNGRLFEIGAKRNALLALRWQAPF